MNIPRTPAELRELALQLAVDLARNGRLPLSAIPDETTTSYADAVIASATQFATFLQGPDPAPASERTTTAPHDLQVCTCGHTRVAHRRGIGDCGWRCGCPTFVPASQFSPVVGTVFVTNIDGRPFDPRDKDDNAVRNGHALGTVDDEGRVGCIRCYAWMLTANGWTSQSQALCAPAPMPWDARPVLSPEPDKSDDAREEVPLIRAHAWGDADPKTGVVRCKDCLGRRWGRPFAPGDNAVGERPCPGVPTCPACRHEAHADVCFNFASDDDCSCVFDSRTIGFASATPGVVVHPSHDARSSAGSIWWCHTCGLTLSSQGAPTESGVAPCLGGYSDDQDGSPS